MTAAKSKSTSAVKGPLAGGTPRSVKCSGSVTVPSEPPSQMYTRPRAASLYVRSKRMETRWPASGWKGWVMISESERLLSPDAVCRDRRNTKAALAAAWLGNPDPANHPRAIGSVKQAPTKYWQQFAQMLAHLVDTAAIRSRGPTVLCHFPKRPYQVFITRHLFHRHRRQGLSGCGSRLRHRIPGWGCGLARPSPGNGPLRAVGCLEKQIPLACLFAGRGRLPSLLAVSSWDRLSTAFR